MKYEIEITTKAKSDIRGIYDYIASELLAPETAANQLDRLEKSILGLGFMPSRFRKYGSELWQSRGLRIMPVDNFAVLYIPDKNTKIVTIICVMYCGRDIEKQLDSLQQS